MIFSLSRIACCGRYLSSLLCVSAAPAVFAASFLGVDVSAPLPSKNVVDTHWGTPVDDPYRFLEDTKDPLVQSWMKGQADATEAILAKLPVRTELRARLAEIEAAVPANINSVRRTRDGAYFALRRNAEDNQFKLVKRDGVDGKDVVLVDPDALAKTAGTAQAIGEYSLSPDGKMVAYSISSGGAEIGSLHVIDVSTGKPRIAPITNIRGASVAWLDDSSGFFYTRLAADWASLPRADRFLDSKYYFNKLTAAEADPMVFGAAFDPSLHLSRSAGGAVFAVRGSMYAYALMFDGVKREASLYMAPLADVLAAKAKWRRAFGEDAMISTVTIAGGWIYARSARDAPRYKVLRMPVADPDPAKAETLIAAGDDVIVELAAAKDAL